MKEDFYFVERPCLIIDPYKLTFLRPFEEKKDTHILVIEQHIYSNETRIKEFNYEELYYFFPKFAGDIIRHFNKPVLTYKPPKL